jgi:hypothetical protein
MRLILMNAGQFYLCGYSQGAEVVVRTLRLMLPGQPLAHRAGDLLKVITFGSPCRPPGPTLLGNNPPGSGISRIDTPEQFRSRTYDFVLDGDIYATATDDTLLHLGYEALTPLELDLPFALKIFTLIQSNEFLSLLNLANTPENFAKLVRTAIVVGDFLIRNPQIHYNDWPASTGSPVSTARCRLSRRARRAVRNPIMEACGTTGGRFQPASSAGLLWSGPFSWPRYI